MKAQITLLVIVVLALTMKSQHVALRGQVTIQNSLHNHGKVEYVPNAAISAPFTAPAYSDANGAFKLEFATLPGKTGVKVTVEHPDLEVVNTKDLEHVIISQDRPLQITMAKKGHLAVAQTEFYEICKKALYAERDARIARLCGSLESQKQTIAEMEDEFGRSISDRFAAEELLIARISEIEERLPQVAIEMASLNLDLAGELHKKAYSQFMEGDIQGAIAILDSLELFETYENAIHHLEQGKELQRIGQVLLEKGNSELDQVIESYKAKAEWYALISQYRNSLRAQQVVVEMLKNRRIGAKDLDVGKAIAKLAVANVRCGNCALALELELESLGILHQILPDSSEEIVNGYNDLAVVYHCLGDYFTAASIMQKTLQQEKLNPNARISGLAISHNNLGVLLKDIGDYELACKIQMEAIRLAEQCEDVDELTMAIYYDNLAIILKKLTRYQDALWAVSCAIQIKERKLKHDDLEFARSYNNLSLIYRGLGEYQKSIEMQEKSISIKLKSEAAEDNDIAISYNNLAASYISVKEWSLAKQFSIASIALQKAAKQINHVAKSAAYNNLGVVFFKTGRLDSAAYFKSLAFQEVVTVYPENHPQMRALGNDLEMILRLQQDHAQLVAIATNMIAAFEKMWLSGSRNAEIYYLMGVCHFEIGNFQRAILALQFALRYHSRKKLEILSFCGISNAKLGSFDEAKLNFMAMSELSPNYPSLFSNWSLYYALKGNPDLALQNLQKAIDLGYSDWHWIQTEEALESIRNTEGYKKLMEQAPKNEE